MKTITLPALRGSDALGAASLQHLAQQQQGGQMQNMPGMDHSQIQNMHGMDHSQMQSMPGMDHSQMQNMQGMDHGNMRGNPSAGRTAPAMKPSRPGTVTPPHTN